MENIPKKLMIKIIVILFTILMLILIFIKIKNNIDPVKIEETQKAELFAKIDSNSIVNITKFSIYGNYFNIEGSIDIPKISGINIDYVDLIITNLKDNPTTIKSDYSYSDNVLAFTTSEQINDGIDLENLDLNTYYLLLKLTYSNSDIKYYSLKNMSEYQDITYYTITKNSSNKKIEICFNEYNSISYMELKVSAEDELPEDIYDIALDINSNSNEEAELLLSYSSSLKSKLENLGLKVLVTSDNLETLKNHTEYSIYDEDGRVTLINNSHAKLMLSFQINNDTSSYSGLEIYSPSNCNLDFATSIANNIVEQTSINYSTLKNYKKAEGVYVRNFTSTDILSSKTRLEKLNIEPYNITTSTPYLYIIREIGGISTNAFVDGRNPSYGTNQYYNSNIGIEGYLISLGYKNEIDTIMENIEQCTTAISEIIQNRYEL